MKKSLTITGRVELTHDEITKGIAKFLKDEHGLEMEKLVYEIIDDAGLPFPKAKLSGVVAYVHQTADEDVPRFGKEPKKERNSPTEEITRRNMGVNDTIRAVLNQAFKKRVNTNMGVTVLFRTLLDEIVFQHPGMDEEKLRVYLYDRRQIPNIDWLARENKIVVRGEINH